MKNFEEIENLKKKIKELEELTYRHELYIKSFDRRLAEIKTSKKGRETSGMKSKERSEIMKRAQELKKEGLSMSEAMKKAHQEISGKESQEIEDDREKFKGDVRERFIQRYEEEVRELEDAEAIEQYDDYDYNTFKKLVKEQDKIAVVVSSADCPSCEWYEGVVDDARQREPSLKIGTIMLDESEAAERLADKLAIKNVPQILIYHKGEEKNRVVPKLQKERDVQEIIEKWK